jgi:hypothetical protein
MESMVVLKHSAYSADALARDYSHSVIGQLEKNAEKNTP